MKIAITKKDKLLDLIQNKKWRLLKKEVEKLDQIKIVEIFEDIEVRDRLIIFRLLNNKQKREVFKQLTHDNQLEVINGLAENPKRVSTFLNNIGPDDRTAFLGDLPQEVAHEFINLLSPDQKEVAHRLLAYPKESIGRLMTTEFLAIKADLTVEEAFDHLREHGKKSETLNIIYIVDDNFNLIDDITIKELILAKSTEIVNNLIDHKFIYLNAKDDQETAIQVFKDYDRSALPVIGETGKLLGIVTFDDVMDVAERESSEDFQKFGSFKKTIANPLKARIVDLYKSRVFWLMALVFMNVFSGAALASFEDVIEQFVGLVFFLPLLIDSGGNAGSQTATLMVRSLAMGDVKIADWGKLIGKELVVSILLGITMAAGVSLVASFRAPDIIFVVAATMLLTVLVGSVVGLILPFIFTRMKLDPAAASAPLITTIADISGVVIYFSIASWYLGF